MDASRVGREISVNRDFGEQRAGYLQDRVQNQEYQRPGDQSAVGPQISQQPAHQTGIVGFGEDLFFHSYLV